MADPFDATQAGGTDVADPFDDTQAVARRDPFDDTQGDDAQTEAAPALTAGTAVAPKPNRRLFTTESGPALPKPTKPIITHAEPIPIRAGAGVPKQYHPQPTAEPSLIRDPTYPSMPFGQGVVPSTGAGNVDEGLLGLATGGMTEYKQPMVSPEVESYMARKDLFHQVERSIANRPVADKAGHAILPSPQQQKRRDDMADFRQRFADQTYYVAESGVHVPVPELDDDLATRAIAEWKNEGRWSPDWRQEAVQRQQQQTGKVAGMQTAFEHRADIQRANAARQPILRVSAPTPQTPEEAAQQLAQLPDTDPTKRDISSRVQQQTRPEQPFDPSQMPLERSTKDEISNLLVRARDQMVMQPMEAASRIVGQAIVPEGGELEVARQIGEPMRDFRQSVRRSDSLRDNYLMDVADSLPQLAAQFAAAYATGGSSLAFASLAVLPVMAQSYNDTYDLVAANGGSAQDASSAAFTASIANGLVTAITSKAEFAFLKADPAAQRTLLQFVANRVRGAIAEGAQESVEQIGQEAMDVLVRAGNDIESIPFEQRLQRALRAAAVGAGAGSLAPRPSRAARHHQAIAIAEAKQRQRRAAMSPEQATQRQADQERTARTARMFATQQKTQTPVATGAATPPAAPVVSPSAPGTEARAGAVKPLAIGDDAVVLNEVGDRVIVSGVVTKISGNKATIRREDADGKGFIETTVPLKHFVRQSDTTAGEVITPRTPDVLPPANTAQGQQAPTTAARPVKAEPLPQGAADDIPAIRRAVPEGTPGDVQAKPPPSTSVVGIGGAEARATDGGGNEAGAVSDGGVRAAAKPAAGRAPAAQPEAAAGVAGEVEGVGRAGPDADTKGREVERPAKHSAVSEDGRYAYTDQKGVPNSAIKTANAEVDRINKGRKPDEQLVLIKPDKALGMAFVIDPLFDAKAVEPKAPQVTPEKPSPEEEPPFALMPPVMGIEPSTWIIGAALMHPGLRRLAKWPMDWWSKMSLRRVGDQNNFGRTFASTARKAVDYARKIKGQLSPLLKRFQKASSGGAMAPVFGPLARAMRDLSSMVKGNYAAFSKFQMAVLGDIPMSSLTPQQRTVVRLARKLNVETGLVAENDGWMIQDHSGAIRLFKHTPGGTTFPAAHTPEFHAALLLDINSHELRGIVRAYQEANPKMSRAQVLSNVNKLREAALTRSAPLETERYFPRTPSWAAIDLPGGGQSWLKTLESDPFNYGTAVVDRIADRAGYIKYFGQDIGKHRVSQAYVEKFVGEGGSQRDITNLIRELNNMPVDKPIFSPGGPDRGARYSAMRWLVRPLLTVFKVARLTKSFAPNLTESLNTLGYVGLKRWVQAWMMMVRHPISSRQETLQTGARTADIGKFTVTRGRLPEDVQNLLAQYALFPAKVANEVNEWHAAVAAGLMARDAQAGRGGVLDAISLKNVGYSDAEVVNLLTGKGTQDEYNAMAGRIANAAQGTIARRAELSERHNTNWANILFFADRFGAMTFDRLATALRTWAGEFNKTGGHRAAATYHLLRALGLRATAGFGGLLIAALLANGLAGMIRELLRVRDEPLEVLKDSAKYAILSGPADAMFPPDDFRRKQQAWYTRLAESFVPVSVMNEIHDMSNGTGVYRNDTTFGDTVASFLRRNVPIARPIRMMALASFYGQSGREQVELERAISLYWKWRRRNLPTGIHLEPDEQEHQRFRLLMKQAQDALLKGDDPSGQIAEALKIKKQEFDGLYGKAENSIKSSLRSRQLLGDDLADKKGEPSEERAALKRYIGDELFRVLERHDAVLDAAADEYPDSPHSFDELTTYKPSGLFSVNGRQYEVAGDEYNAYRAAYRIEAAAETARMMKEDPEFRTLQKQDKLSDEDLKDVRRMLSEIASDVAKDRILGDSQSEAEDEKRLEAAIRSGKIRKK